jgi:spermidine/putrescine transport system permease protein
LFIGIALLVAFSRVDVTLSLVTVTIAHLVYVFPFFFLIARAALERLDPALEETAADLGANRWTAFRRVTIPQVWPVLVGAACLAFALSFDEFVITFFVIGPDSTLPMFIWSSLRRTIDPSINAISSLLLLFTMLLFMVTFALTTWSERRRRGRGLGEDPLALAPAPATEAVP